MGKTKSGRRGKNRILSERRRWEENLIRQDGVATLGSTIGELVQFLNAEDIIAEQTAIVIWDQVVGEKIAQEAQPKSIKNGILKVKVRNAVWRQELTFMKDDIVKRLNNELDGKFVSEIIFS